MLGFKQFHNIPDVQHDATPDDLKAHIDASQYNSARFMIHPDNTMSVSNYRAHLHLEKHGNGDPYKNGSTFGYAGKHNGRYYYGGYKPASYDKNSDIVNKASVVTDHPVFNTLEKKGFKRGVVIKHDGIRPPNKGDDLNVMEAKQYLTEAKLHWGEDAESPVYENPSKSHLKALSTKSGVIGWRWLQQGKKIYVGNASHYIHDDIATAVGIKASMENPIRGGMSSVERLAKDGYDVTKGGRSMVEISRKNWILPPKKERVEDEYGYDVDDNEWDGH